jgi:hypothetical protein
MYAGTLAIVEAIPTRRKNTAIENQAVKVLHSLMNDVKGRVARSWIDSQWLQNIPNSTINVLLAPDKPVFITSVSSTFIFDIQSEIYMYTSYY